MSKLCRHIACHKVAVFDDGRCFEHSSHTAVDRYWWERNEQEARDVRAKKSGRNAGRGNLWNEFQRMWAGKSYRKRER